MINLIENKISYLKICFFAQNQINFVKLFLESNTMSGFFRNLSNEIIT
jgi:hypothetical protein